MLIYEKQEACQKVRSRDAAMKKKKTPTGEVGYAQGQAGENMLAGSQSIEPDASSGQSEVLDNTNVESIQLRIIAMTRGPFA